MNRAGPSARENETDQKDQIIFNNFIFTGRLKVPLTDTFCKKKVFLNCFVSAWFVLPKVSSNSCTYLDTQSLYLFSVILMQPI